MAADSSQAGYLAPAPPGPLYDKALEDFFQAFVVGITGLPGNLVRPRWQPNPPTVPDAKTNWIAMGVVVGAKQWNAYQHFDALLGVNGSYVVEGVESIRVNVSFYGPDNESSHRLFEDGLQIDQNRWMLDPQRITFKSCDPPVNLPALLKERWVQRSDVQVHFDRWVTRVYPILTILSADVDLNNERYVTHIPVSPPSS